MEFDAFYRSSYERVHRAMALAFRDDSLAEDVTQEAFYRALRRWPKVSKLDHPEAWTMVVALNCGRGATISSTEGPGAGRRGTRCRQER
jgi:predicted RNA polymerase sigma factor